MRGIGLLSAGLAFGNLEYINTMEDPESRFDGGRGVQQFFHPPAGALGAITRENKDDEKAP
jgi:hypothetical protein